MKGCASVTESRSHVLLAPRTGVAPSCFDEVMVRPLTRERLLARVQKLRGLMYMRHANPMSPDLTADGRLTSPLDDLSWHLVALDAGGEVVGCVRMMLHPKDRPFEGLYASHSALAQSARWGIAVRGAIDSERSRARRKGFSFFEIGAWVVADTVRCTLEAAHLALGVFAFAQLMGGGIGITTATRRNHSAGILQRIGGLPLRHNGTELPAYYDPQHLSEMALLRFESGSYDPKYHLMVEQLRLELKMSPVLCATAAFETPRTVAPAREFHAWPAEALPLPA